MDTSAYNPRGTATKPVYDYVLRSWVWKNPPLRYGAMTGQRVVSFEMDMTHFNQFGRHRGDLVISLRYRSSLFQDDAFARQSNQRVFQLDIPLEQAISGLYKGNMPPGISMEDALDFCVPFHQGEAHQFVTQEKLFTNRLDHKEDVVVDCYASPFDEHHIQVFDLFLRIPAAALESVTVLVKDVIGVKKLDKAINQCIDNATDEVKCVDYMDLRDEAKEYLRLTRKIKRGEERYNRLKAAGSLPESESEPEPESEESESESEPEQQRPAKIRKVVVISDSEEDESDEPEPEPEESDDQAAVAIAEESDDEESAEDMDEDEEGDGFIDQEVAEEDEDEEEKRPESPLVVPLEVLKKAADKFDAKQQSEPDPRPLAVGPDVQVIRDEKTNQTMTLSRLVIDHPMFVRHE